VSSGPPAAGWRRRIAPAPRRAGRRVAWLAVGRRGAGIAFTVQVIAVSDQTTAIDISRGLLRDGFPAYVVRSTGGQGDVYRVRVGAFANRAPRP
jgi:cell division septation protein DedD